MKGKGDSHHQLPRSGRALERADDLVGDPAAIEVTLLGLNPLLTHEAGVHLAGIECETISDFGNAAVGAG